MASFTLGPDVRFPPGTLMRIYQGSSLGQPVGPEVTSATVAADSTTLVTGLTGGMRYVAGTSTVGPFTTFLAPTGENVAVAGLASFDLIEDPDTGWPERPQGAQSGTWIGWTDPTELMSEFDRFIAIPEPE